MPERNRIRTVTGGPQGKDAVIVVIIPTVTELRYPQEIVREHGANSPEAREAANVYLQNHVSSWNWVNDAGEPLPQPKVSIDVFDELTPEELAFIGKALNGESAEAVKERKK